MKLKPPIEHRSRKLNLVVDGEHLPAFEEYQRYYHETYGKEMFHHYHPFLYRYFLV